MVGNHWWKAFYFSVFQYSRKCYKDCPVRLPSCLSVCKQATVCVSCKMKSVECWPPPHPQFSYGLQERGKHWAKMVDAETWSFEPFLQLSQFVRVYSLFFSGKASCHNHLSQYFSPPTCLDLKCCALFQLGIWQSWKLFRSLLPGKV